MANEIEGLTDEQIRLAREGYVPIDRLNEATGKLKDDNAQLQESLASLATQVQALQSDQQASPTTAHQQETKPTFTRAQLREAVTSGQISQVQADDIWDEQQERKWQDKLDKELSRVKEETRTDSNLQTLRSTVVQYRDEIPDIAKAGTEERTKLKAEFDRLARVMGMPKADSKEDFQLQVLALENVYGSIDNVREKKRRKVNDDHDLMEDTLSGSVDSEKPKAGLAKKLSPSQRAYYEKAIGKGIYKSWDDVEKELGWKRKSNNR